MFQIVRYSLQNNDGMVGEEEADFYMAEHTEYDQEAFLNTAWNLMKPVVRQILTHSTSRQ